MSGKSIFWAAEKEKWQPNQYYRSIWTLLLFYQFLELISQHLRGQLHSLKQKFGGHRLSGMTPAFILSRWEATEGPSHSWTRLPPGTSHQHRDCMAINKHLQCGWIILHFLVINTASKAPTEGMQIKMLNQTQKRNLKINFRFPKKRPGIIIKTRNSQLQLLHFLILGQN